MKTDITLQQMKRRLESLRRTLVVSAVLSSMPFGFAMAAATLRVPADYTTIQAAVNAAAPAGDEILIASGVYTQQVFITQKKLTLTGSPGTVLEAWTGMSQIPGVPVYTLVWVTTNADVVIRNIEFDGKRLAASMPRTGAGVGLEGVHFFGASGRVENCVFRSFRGLNNLGTTIVPPLGGRGFALLAFNPVGTTPGVVHLQVLNCTFSDTAQSMNFAGDYGLGPFDPSLLRMTFVAEGNTVAGVGPTNDFQWGILVLGGASGIVKNNRITDHQNASGGYWSEGIHACPDTPRVAPLQPLRVEGNTFVGNQKHMTLVLGDNSRVINNIFDGWGSAPSSDGIWLTGSNVLTAINLFTNVSTGVVLAANNWRLGPQSGVAVNPSVFANQFCGVISPVKTDPDVVGANELGTEYCPSVPPGFGNLICSPGSGLPGTTVALSGTNLAGATTVLFNGLSADFTNGTDPDRLITATVPPHATTGPVTVITPLGNITSLTPFTVPVPLAMSLQPGGLVQLSWCAEACDLLLECTSSVTTPDWQSVLTSPAVGAESVTWTGPVRNGAQFFRLRQP